MKPSFLHPLQMNFAFFPIPAAFDFFKISTKFSGKRFGQNSGSPETAYYSLLYVVSSFTNFLIAGDKHKTYLILFLVLRISAFYVLSRGELHRSAVGNKIESIGT